MKSSKIKSNVVSLFILKFFQIGLNFLLFPFLIRTLGSGVYGRLLYANSIAIIILVVVNYGFNYSATREIAIADTDDKRKENIVNMVLSLKCILFLFSIFSLFFITLFISQIEDNFLLISLFLLLVLGDIIFPQFFFQGIQEMKNIANINIGIKTIGVIVILFVVRVPSDVYIVPLVQGICSIVGGFYAFRIINKKILNYKFYFVTFSLCTELLKSSTPFFLSNITSTIKDRAAAIMIVTFLGYGLATYYEIGLKIVLFVATFLGAIGEAFYPVFSISENRQKNRAVLFYLASFGILAYLGLYIFKEYIYVFIGGSEASQYSKTFPFISLSLLLLPISIYYGYLKLGARGYSKYFSIGVISGGVFYFLGLLFLYYFSSVTIFALSILYALTNLIELLVFIVFNLKIRS